MVQAPPGETAPQEPQLPARQPLALPLRQSLPEGAPGERPTQDGGPGRGQGWARSPLLTRGAPTISHPKPPCASEVLRNNRGAYSIFCPLLSCK